MRRVALLLVITLLAGNAATGASSAMANPADARCLRLESRIADLRLKLRLGYSARQGRVWRQQVAALEAERRQACRR